MSKRRGVFSVGTFLIYFIIAAILLSIIVVFVSFLISKWQTQTLYTSEHIRSDLHVQRFIRSPDCFAYYDFEINRGYPSMVDWEKFTNSRLERCFSHQNLGYQLTLTNLENSSEKVVQTFNWGARPDRTFSRPVLIKHNQLFRGKLNIEIQK